MDPDQVSLYDLTDAGLLSQEQQTELMAWFQASSRAPVELPENLYRLLSNALALFSLDEEATRH